jgi:hypothetical protein
MYKSLPSLRAILEELLPLQAEYHLSKIENKRRFFFFFKTKKNKKLTSATTSYILGVEYGISC